METSYSQGRLHLFFLVFNCFGETINIHWNNRERLFRSIWGATYTMDGRLFVGWHTPDSYEDFDEFSVLAPDTICCCFGCCYNSDKYQTEWSDGLKHITEQGNNI